MLALSAGLAQAEPTRKVTPAAPVPVEQVLDDYARRIRALCLPVDPPVSVVVRLPLEKES